jgi:NAD(P)-dependent dehydrogenase (short-subunit alcohol dehydrogenase family)
MGKRILVTGGAGFLGSHLCERLLEAGHDVLCVDNYFTGTKANVAGLPRQSALRTDASRRDLPALRRGRRDLQSRLPGVADPLPARPGADDQDQRARRDQHAGAGQAGAGQDLPGLDQRGLRRPDRAPAGRELSRQRQSARPAPATTRASAAPRRCSSTITASTGCASRWRASSTPTVRACIPTTAGWCRTSSCRR